MQENAQNTEDKREIHLLDYWRVVWQGRWTVLAIFVVVVTLVAIGTFTQTPIYRASATIEIAPQARKVSPVADVAQLGTSNYSWFSEERYFNTQYEIIKSRDVSQLVFEQLDLHNHPKFRQIKDPVGALRKMIQVEPVKNTGIVRISLEGDKPEEVTTWVNTVAESYVQRNLDQAIHATATAVEALLQEISPLKERLEDTQRTSFEFAERANLYVPENQQKITNERLSTLQSELTNTQVKRASIESLLSQINEVSVDGAAFETIPQIGNDRVIQSLYREKVALEREKERLLVTFKDRHVRVLEKASEIDKVNQKIASEADRIIKNFHAERALLRDREGMLESSINETRIESLQVSRKTSDYEVVRSEVAETKRIYDLISARVKEIDLSSSLLNNNLRILDRAPLPRTPVKPRTVLNMAVGCLLGLLLGCGVVFFLDYLDNTIRSSADVEEYLKLNLLALVPKAGEHTERAVREAYQTLRTSLLFSRKNRSANAVLVTSAGPQEGKSNTVVGVARTLAASGEKVVVVDCDLRRPAIHRRFDLGQDGGLTNFILSPEGENWRQFVRQTDEPNLYAITSGPLPPNPVDVFGHERFQKLMSQLREEFDWVFIDSPPIASLADSIVLSSLSDMVVLVVKHNTNDRELIKRCANSIKKINPNVIGAVLNHVDLDRSSHKDYYYVGYYYYGEPGSKKGKKQKGASRPASLAGSTTGDGVKRSVG